MTNFYFYVIRCLLVASALKWRTATSLPVHTQLSAEECPNCSALFMNLLTNIRGILNNDDVLFHGIKSNKTTVSSLAETPQACAPNIQQNSNCMAQRSTPFSESECLMSIMKDIVHYEALIESYLKLTLKRPKEEKALLSPTLKIIQNLKNCFLRFNGGMNPAEEDMSRMWVDDSYTNRLEMFKLMRGFYIRVITINRAMGYISSGDHRV
ncbi:interleukin-12 subunit alpha [Syngnathus typhle]|uniref:interleukin-12 subunit alpha n=1 Tax=Syngnathus typhle TaxID=161592 RepID=UPI002A6AA73E|nr:interleukin-12 subunit alpha [Syngnathus typhle]